MPGSVICVGEKQKQQLSCLLPSFLFAFCPSSFLPLSFLPLFPFFSFPLYIFLYAFLTFLFINYGRWTLDLVLDFLEGRMEEEGREVQLGTDACHCVVLAFACMVCAFVLLLCAVHWRVGVRGVCMAHGFCALLLLCCARAHNAFPLLLHYTIAAFL